MCCLCGMASRKALLIASATAMAVVMGALLPATTSAWPDNHMVGENEGWQLGVNYEEWVQYIDGDFKAGDTLQFFYLVADHNVVRVDEAGYNACDATNSIETWNNGDDYVELPYAGKFFFICGMGDHCIRGMKLAVIAV